MGVLDADSNELVLVDVEVKEEAVEPRFRGTVVKLPVELPEAGVNIGEGDEVNSGPTVGSVMFNFRSKVLLRVQGKPKNEIRTNYVAQCGR